VLNIFTSDYPEISEFADHNDEQTLIYLAGVNVREIRLWRQRSYSRRSAASITRQLKTAIIEMLKFYYYFGFAVILERLSPNLI